MRGPRLVLALCALALAACVAHAFPMHDLAHGHHSAFNEPAQLIILDQPAWQALWEQRLDGAPPEVDFEREMVVGVTLGARPTGGYAVRIESIERTADGTLVVTVRERAPGQDVMVSQAFTQPYHFVRVPRVDAPVVFRLASDE